MIPHIYVLLSVLLLIAGVVTVTIYIRILDRRDQALLRERERQRRLRAAQTQPALVPLPIPAETPENMYLDWCAQRLDEQGAEDAAAFEQAYRASAKAADDLAEGIAGARIAELTAVALERIQKEQAAASSGSFDRAVARPEIARVELTEYGWRFITTPVVSVQNGRKFRIGKMEVHVGKDGRVRIFNQTKRMKISRHTYDHPLVRRGFPLLPIAVRLAVLQAVANQDIDGAIAAILPFLVEIPTETLAPPARWPEEINGQMGTLVAEL